MSPTDSFAVLGTGRGLSKDRQQALTEVERARDDEQAVEAFKSSQGFKGSGRFEVRTHPMFASDPSMVLLLDDGKLAAVSTPASKPAFSRRAKGCDPKLAEAVGLPRAYAHLSKMVCDASLREALIATGILTRERAFEQLTLSAEQIAALNSLPEHDPVDYNDAFGAGHTALHSALALGLIDTILTGNNTAPVAYKLNDDGRFARQVCVPAETLVLNDDEQAAVDAFRRMEPYEGSELSVKVSKSLKRPKSPGGWRDDVAFLVGADNKLIALAHSNGLNQSLLRGAPARLIKAASLTRRYTNISEIVASPPQRRAAISTGVISEQEAFAALSVLRNTQVFDEIPQHQHELAKDIGKRAGVSGYTLTEAVRGLVRVGLATVNGTLDTISDEWLVALTNDGRAYRQYLENLA